MGHWSQPREIRRIKYKIHRLHGKVRYYNLVVKDLENQIVALRQTIDNYEDKKIIPPLKNDR